MPAAPPAAPASTTSTLPPPFRRIAVFCGSSAGTLPEFRQAAVELGTEMAKRGIGLVYGGRRWQRQRGESEDDRKQELLVSVFFFDRPRPHPHPRKTPKHTSNLLGGNIGLMGAVAESVSSGGQRVIGVIPKVFQPREVRWRGRGGRQRKSEQKRGRETHPHLAFFFFFFLSLSFLSPEKTALTRSPDLSFFLSSPHSSISDLGHDSRRAPSSS